ncbi:MAG: hypothetical protein ABFR97_08540 [Thermodesulfobacteriota bacterium]
MFKQVLVALTILCFLAPALALAEFAPQFKESSKGSADLSKNAPAHGKVFKSQGAMEQKGQHKAVSKNKEAMERSVSQENQPLNVQPGQVNE